jgi:hypothetical protein
MSDTEYSPEPSEPSEVETAETISTKSLFVQEVGAAELRANVWREALERNGGNIAAASAEYGFTKQRGHALTKRHGLLELAKTLKTSLGQPVRGRPRMRPDTSRIVEKPDDGRPDGKVDGKADGKADGKVESTKLDLKESFPLTPPAPRSFRPLDVSEAELTTDTPPDMFVNRPSKSSSK